MAWISVRTARDHHPIFAYAIRGWRHSAATDDLSHYMNRGLELRCNPVESPSWTEFSITTLIANANTAAAIDGCVTEGRLVSASPTGIDIAMWRSRSEPPSY